MSPLRFLRLFLIAQRHLTKMWRTKSILGSWIFLNLAWPNGHSFIRLGIEVQIAPSVSFRVRKDRFSSAPWDESFFVGPVALVGGPEAGGVEAIRFTRARTRARMVRLMEETIEKAIT